MVDPASSAQQQLVELLLDLFSHEELRRFVHVRYPKLARDLREGTSHHAQADSLVATLQRHGELDEDLFAGLRGERPKRATQIDDLAALFPSRKAGARPAADATHFDAQIADCERRIAALAQDGLDTQHERAELLRLREQRRAYPNPIRGLRLAGRYTLDIELGQGGFASVWRAFDRQASRRVALKILHSHHAADLIRRDRFARGMRTMRSLDHPNILQVHEPELVSDGFVFAVLELVPGGDLHQAYLHQRMSCDHVWPILLAICDALALVHDRGFVHRDIKPSNVLLNDTGTPFLTDFDLVLDHETAGGTRTGALGSVIYSAPELWSDAHAATPSADVYSLAMTAVFAHRSAHPSPAILRDMNAELDDLDLTPALRDVLRRALAWTPEDRYRDARALGQALQAALLRPLPPEDTSADPLAAHDILYWIADERGRAETVWLTGTAHGAKVLGRAPGITLAAGPRVWRLVRDTRQIAGSEQTSFRPERYTIVPFDFEVADLVELSDARRVPLGIFTGPSQPDIPIGTELEDPDVEAVGPAEFDHTVSLTFSAGPYLFVRSSSYACYHGAAHGSADVGFEIIDLRTGTECDILSPEERSDLTQELSAKASAQLDQEHGDREVPEFDIPQDDPTPRLTMYYAHYDLDGKLELTYQFTRDTYYAASDNLWHDYTCSTRIPAPRLPAALQGLAAAPRLLQQHWQTTPHHAGNHGWTAAPRTPHIRRLLHHCFDQHTRPRAQ